MLQLPPAMLFPNTIGIVIVRADIDIDPTETACEKGSRDCFPEDRVGGMTETTTLQVILPTVLSWAAAAAAVGSL